MSDRLFIFDTTLRDGEQVPGWAFAKAEAYMINNSLAVPCYYDVRWCLTHVNEYTNINAMFGPCNFKYVNWETSEDAYTTAQYEEFAKAFDAAKS